jgi:hypothetical protein
MVDIHRRLESRDLRLRDGGWYRGPRRGVIRKGGDKKEG